MLCLEPRPSAHQARAPGLQFRGWPRGVAVGPRYPGEAGWPIHHPGAVQTMRGAAGPARAVGTKDALLTRVR